MALMTAKEYIDSLRKLNTRVYMFGEKIDNWVDHPMIRPSINCVAMTYALAQDPQYEELMTATSSLTGHKINRFTHLHQSADDLVKKVKMQRLLGQKTASCFQRCVGMDAFNAVFSSTYEIDEKYGTHYHENFKKFLVYVQDNDLTVDGAMTDPKGDRSKAPHEQADPDMYVHVVERRDDGIVVCGAKCHQTGSINSHWHIFMPTIAMGEADKDYAVSFACPTDAEGLYMIYGRQSCDTRKLEEGCIDVGNAKFGGQEALVVLDHVFIPNEYIFLNGEYEFAGTIVERFAGYHRQSYGGCKVGVGDVVIGAAALAAEYNGVEKASAVKDKLIEMTHLNETLYSCGIACSCEGCPTKAGNYQIDLLLANVCRGHRRRIDGHHAQRDGLQVRHRGGQQRRDHRRDLQQVFRCPGGRQHRGSPADHALPGEHVPGRCRCGLSHGIHARRWLSPGPAHHDRPPGEYSGQEEAGQEHRRYPEVGGGHGQEASVAPAGAGEVRPLSEPARRRV